ncbi:MAG: hypothetical protein PHH30_02610 [Bacteroidales bacterium]|nr:hypothetical protein [Bacteroidales bacterium]
MARDKRTIEQRTIEKTKYEQYDNARTRSENTLASALALALNFEVRAIEYSNKRITNSMIMLESEVKIP